MIQQLFITRRARQRLDLPFHFQHPAGDDLSIKEIGDYGEQVACDYLITQNAKIIYRNYEPVRGGEIDIIAREGNELLFIEVKSRRSNTLIRPIYAVDKEKIAYIKRGADSWLFMLNRRKISWRFDIMEVLLTENQKPEVRWIKDAF